MFVSIEETGNYKIMRLTVIRNELKRTISTSSGFAYDTFFQSIYVFVPFSQLNVISFRFYDALVSQT